MKTSTIFGLGLTRTTHGIVYACVDKIERHKMKNIVEHLSELDQVMMYIYIIYIRIYL